MNQKVIYHITTKDWWNKWMDSEYYESPTLNEEKFIHLSTENQVEGVLERYYKNQTDLLKLHVDTEKLTEELIYEPSTNDELFPHLYGRLNKNAILRIEEL